MHSTINTPFLKLTVVQLFWRVLPPNFAAVWTWEPLKNFKQDGVQPNGNLSDADDSGCK